jgi:hypothetical protein
MGKISFGPEKSSSPSDTTKSQYDREIDGDQLELIVKKISERARLSSERVCYVYGSGGISLGTYEKISKLDGVDLVFTKSVLPFFLSFLRPLIASESGLVRVKDPLILPDVFEFLTNQSMATIFIFSTEYESSFIEQVRQSSVVESFDFGVKKDPSYFMYLADTDNSESKTGIYEFVSIGVNSIEDV